jgi:hypothetical protein
MQQWWTFGYHQSNWDWKNWDELEQVVGNFSMYAIPLETMWSDIDYMDQYRNFQNDPVNYPYDQGATFIDSLHQNGMQYVPIVDPIIYYPNPNGDTAEYVKPSLTIRTVTNTETATHLTIVVLRLMFGSPIPMVACILEPAGLDIQCTLTGTTLTRVHGGSMSYLCGVKTSNSTVFGLT